MPEISKRGSRGHREPARRITLRDKSKPIDVKALVISALSPSRPENQESMDAPLGGRLGPARSALFPFAPARFVASGAGRHRL